MTGKLLRTTSGAGKKMGAANSVAAPLSQVCVAVVRVKEIFGNRKGTEVYGPK